MNQGLLASVSIPWRICPLGRLHSQGRTALHTAFLFQMWVPHLPVPSLGGVECGGRKCVLAHQVSTAEDNGILLYNGDNDHMAVELYQGHVRVSYDPGSYPSSAIYR